MSRRPFTHRWVCYLIFDAQGIRGMTKTEPNLSGGQHAVRLKLSVSNSLWARRLPQATLTIPESAIISPKVEVLPAEAMLTATECGVCHGTGDGLRDPVEGTLPCVACLGSGRAGT